MVSHEHGIGCEALQFYDSREAVPAEKRNGAHAAGVGQAADEDTVIVRGVTIQGSVFVAENVVFNGEIEGTIAVPAHRLTIGSAGRVLGNVQAGEVVAMGTVRGDIIVHQRVVLHAGALEDGAFFKGKVEMI